MTRAYACLLSLILATPAAALDDERVIAYDVSIAGVEIGEANVRLTDAEEAYRVAVDGGFRFLFWSGELDIAVEGSRAGGFAPSSYDMDFFGPTRDIMIDVAFDGGRPSDVSLTPPPEPEWLEGRIEIAPEDMVGAKDPISAFLVPAGSAAEACGHNAKVFSGFVRFDIALSLVGAPADGVAECEVTYIPVSGHRPDNEGVQRLRNGGMSLAVAELAPGVWGPERLGLRTSVGTLAFTRRR